MGLFDIETELSQTKQTIQRNFKFKNFEGDCVGYEIHMGETTVPKNKHLNLMGDIEEGYFDGDKSWGTYLHGIFDNQDVVTELLQLKFPEAQAKNYRQFKADQFDKLADWIDENLDMNTIVKNSSETC